MIEQSSKVSDIVKDYPILIDLFEKVGIDYCCNGGISLEEAAKNNKIDLVKLMVKIKEMELERGGQNIHLIDPEYLTIPALIDYVVARHHVYTKELLAKLTPFVEKVASVHGQVHPELDEIENIFKELMGDLTKHLQREELQVFPLIKHLYEVSSGKVELVSQKSTFDEVWSLISEEHDDAGEMLRQIRTLTNNFTLPPDHCNSYKFLYDGLKQLEKDIHIHVHLENNYLHPKAKALYQSIKVR